MIREVATKAVVSKRVAYVCAREARGLANLTDESRPCYVDRHLGYTSCIALREMKKRERVCDLRAESATRSTRSLC